MLLQSKTPRQSFSPSRQNVVSAEDPSVKDSVHGTGPAVATADPTASRTTAENEDEEDGYSSEEFVVPWSATRAQVAPVAPIVEPTPPDDGDGYYSDELTLEKGERSLKMESGLGLSISSQMRHRKDHVFHKRKRTGLTMNRSRKSRLLVRPTRQPPMCPFTWTL